MIMDRMPRLHKTEAKKTLGAFIHPEGTKETFPRIKLMHSGIHTRARPPARLGGVLSGCALSACTYIRMGYHEIIDDLLGEKCCRDHDPAPVLGNCAT